MAVIPEQAKKVFEGVIFDVYQWEQEMFDGSTETFERLRRAGTVEIILVVDDKILIQKQEQPARPDPYLCLVGGRIDPGEEPLAAAKRETLEESGYKADTWVLIDSIQMTSKIDWTMHLYIARDSKKIQEQKLDAGEKIEDQLVSFDKFIDIIESNELRHIHEEIRILCIRAKHHKPSYDELKKRIFGG